MSGIIRGKSFGITDDSKYEAVRVIKFFVLKYNPRTFDSRCASDPQTHAFSCSTIQKPDYSGLDLNQKVLLSINYIDGSIAHAAELLNKIFLTPIMLLVREADGGLAPVYVKRVNWMMYALPQVEEFYRIPRIVILEAWTNAYGMRHAGFDQQEEPYSGAIHNQSCT